MDKLQQVKAKLEEMKAKYNFELENEDNPNHSDGCGMFYSGFFTCLKEISFFVDNIETKDVDLEEEIIRVSKNEYFDFTDWKSIARHFYEVGLNARKEE